MKTGRLVEVDWVDIEHDCGAIRAIRELRRP